MKKIFLSLLFIGIYGLGWGQPYFQSVNLTFPKCHDSNDGKIDILFNNQFTGGTVFLKKVDPISGSLIGLASGNAVPNGSHSFDNLLPGNYVISLTYTGTDTRVISLTPQSQINITVEELRLPSPVAGSNDGYIRVNATGGTPPYQYQWTGASFGPEKPGLSVGPYTVTVSDQNCTVTRDIAVISKIDFRTNHNFTDLCDQRKVVPNWTVPTLPGGSVFKLEVKHPDNHIELLNYPPMAAPYSFLYGDEYRFQLFLEMPNTMGLVAVSDEYWYDFLGSYPVFTTTLPDNSTICTNNKFNVSVCCVNDIIWDFNDGTPNLTDNYVSHAYQNSGSYEISLVFKQETCPNYDTLKKTVFVNSTYTAGSILDPIIEYKDPLQPCRGDKVKIAVKSTPSTNITWHNPNGKIIQFPSIFDGWIDIETNTSMDADLNDQVFITVSDVCGGTILQSNTITIPFKNNAPIDDNLFDYEPEAPLTICAGDQVEFKVKDYNYNNYNYSWIFPDGDVVNAPLAFKAFSNALNPVNLKIQNKCGNIDFKPIQIMTGTAIGSGLDSADLDFKIAADSICPGDQVLMTFKNAGESYMIDFGDGNSISVSNPEEEVVPIFHTFNGNGTKIITLTVTNHCGQTTVLTDSIHIVTSLLAPRTTFEKEIYWKQGSELTHPIPLAGTIEGCTPTTFATSVPGTKFDWTFVKRLTGDTLGQFLDKTSPDLTFIFDSVVLAKAYVIVENGCAVRKEFDAYVYITPRTCSDLEVIVNVTQPTCTNPKGSAVASVSGSWGSNVNYYYEWDDNGHTFNDSLENVTPGTYTVNVISSTGRTGKGIAVINPVVETFSLSTSTTNATCNLTDGTASVTVAGSISNPSYVWSNGASGSNTITNVAAGIYAVTVTDAVGCSKFALAKVEDNTAFSMNSTVTNVSCHDAKDGKIELDFSGISGNVNVFWSSGHAGHIIDDLKAGTYFAQATNELGCKVYKSFELENPAPVTIDSVSVTAPTPCGNSNGQVTLHVSPGGTSYSYQWSDSTTTGTGVRTDLLAGIYTVTVTNGSCSATETVYVDELPVEILKIAQKLPSCGQNDGMLQASMIMSDATTFDWDSVSWVGPTWNPWDSLNNNNGIYSCTDNEWQNIPYGTKTAVAYGKKWSDLSNTCKSYRYLYLPSVKPQPVDVCLVTVNDSNQNVVVWDTTNANGVEKYLIYREDFLSGDFEEIHQVGANATEYTDKYSDASVKSYRYRMAVEDACGGVSDLTAWHRAAHLNVTKDVATNQIKMDFEPYWGFDYDTLRIWADTTGIKPYTWFEIASVYDPNGVVDSFYFFMSDSAYRSLQTPANEGRLRLSCDYPKADGTCSSAKAENRNSTRSNTDKCCPDGFVGFYADANVDDETTPGSCDGEILLTMFGGDEPYTYEWSDGVTTTDNPRQGLCAGDYTVTVNDAGSLHTTVDVTVSVYVGIQAVNNNPNFRVYPNPATHALYVEALGSELAQHIKLYNISGALVLTHVAENTRAQIQTLHLATLPAGVYYLELGTVAGTGRYLVVKE